MEGQVNNFTGNTFSGQAVGVYNDNRHTVSPEEETLLSEIRDAQVKLADTEPMIAQSLDELRKAIEKGDHRTKAEKAKALSVGFAVDVLKKVAGGVLLKFLGIG